MTLTIFLEITDMEERNIDRFQESNKNAELSSKLIIILSAFVHYAMCESINKYVK